MIFQICCSCALQLKNFNSIFDSLAIWLVPACQPVSKLVTWQGFSVRAHLFTHFETRYGPIFSRKKKCQKTIGGFHSHSVTKRPWKLSKVSFMILIIKKHVITSQSMCANRFLTILAVFDWVPYFWAAALLSLYFFSWSLQARHQTPLTMYNPWMKCLLLPLPTSTQLGSHVS